MADDTIESDEIETMVEVLPTSAIEERNVNGYLSKPYGEYGICEKLEIEIHRLTFLKNCLVLKRPPPSFRIKGASAINSNTKYERFSKWETELLNEAIKEKQLVIDLLKKQCTSKDTLSEADRRNCVEHFQRKIKFYHTQNDTNWKVWPSKQVKQKISRNTRKHYIRRKKRRKKKTECAAKKAIESGSVIVLINEEVPLGAIAVLGKGLNFIPTPNVDILEEQLDMRLVTNNILNTANQLKNANENTDSIINNGNERLPPKLSKKHYGPAKPAEENVINTIVEQLTDEHNGRLQYGNKMKTKKKNITKDEEEGLKWLMKGTEESRLAVVQADKGGALLIVYPSLLRQKVIEKLEDPSLYQKLDKDPTNILHDELFQMWVTGKTKSFVSDVEAKKVMGVTEKNCKSTSSHIKPGTAYFYPMLKIHKLNKADIKPGVNPPARLVTALQEGISKRSDIFLAYRFLKALEKDFCKDLLKDTTGALCWLEELNDEIDPIEKSHLRAFTFDYKSLYDSLKPAHVKEALKHAMDMCRPDWSNELKDWIIDLIDLSLRSAVGKFENSWYLQRNGVPTGGSLCVELANITVYYTMNKLVYSKGEMMKHIKVVKRYIDDGAGFFNSTKRKFDEWIKQVNDALKIYGLNIDESEVEEVENFVSFLDTQFCFDKNGDLQTDLYVKPTDARSYLSFNSCHPNYVYSGIIYSQCLRLRRIINSDERLKIRINELCKCFKDAGYPQKMCDNISEKVLHMERTLETKTIDVEDPINEKPIRVISTFGTDDNLVKAVKNHEKDLLKTRTFINHKKPLFCYVKKTSANIGAKLSVLKSIALGKKHGKTVSCGITSRCKGCNLVPDTQNEHFLVANGHKVQFAPGNCNSRNIIYLVTCNFCDKIYVGKSVQEMCRRFNGHRHCFYTILRNKDIDLDSDDYSLGLHLFHEHSQHMESDFDKAFTVYIVENCSPSSLDKREHMFIHKYNTLHPNGLNKVNPFKLTQLDLSK